MTTNAVTSLSLDPLLLLVCFANDARTLPVVREAGRFGVNVLAAGQEELARRFAGKLPEAEKFEGVDPLARRRRPGARGRARVAGLRARAARPRPATTRSGSAPCDAAELGRRRPAGLVVGGRYGSIAP